MLRELWPTSFAVDLEETFGRSSDCINYKAHRMGLKKDESFDKYDRYGRYTHKGNHFNKHVQ